MYMRAEKILDWLSPIMKKLESKGRSPKQLPKRFRAISVVLQDYREMYDCHILWLFKHIENAISMGAQDQLERVFGEIKNMFLILGYMTPAQLDNKKNKFHLFKYPDK